MPQEITIFEIVGRVLLVLSPIIFAVGILLIMSEYKYRKLEEILGREIGGLKKITFPKLEATVYTFHEKMMEWRIVVGVIFIACSIIFFMVFKDPLV